MPPLSLLALQNADAFEFNDAFVLALAAAHDGEYGATLPRMPFDADCERERPCRKAASEEASLSSARPLTLRPTLKRTPVLKRGEDLSAWQRDRSCRPVVTRIVWCSCGNCSSS